MKRENRILSLTKSFPEYYLQYIIKYDVKNSPFNSKISFETAIENDDVEALIILNDQMPDEMNYSYSLIEAAKLDKSKILEVLQISDEQLIGILCMGIMARSLVPKKI